VAFALPALPSRAPASDVADRLPGIFEDHDLVGPEEWSSHSVRRSHGTRSATSTPLPVLV